MAFSSKTNESESVDYVRESDRGPIMVSTNKETGQHEITAISADTLQGKTISMSQEQFEKFQKLTPAQKDKYLERVGFLMEKGLLNSKLSTSDAQKFQNVDIDGAKKLLQDNFSQLMSNGQAQSQNYRR